MRVCQIIISLALLWGQYSLSAEDLKVGDFGIEFHGFVKTDIMYDTRENHTAREGHFSFYPLPVLLGDGGRDLNEETNLNILSIQTRLTGTITGPEFLGAKTSGMIEAAFFGQNDADINGFRLRHAFVRLDWQTTSLIVGQFWHPMFFTEGYPSVISFNTGVPFQPFSRNPQVRLTQCYEGYSISLAAMSERDFSTVGPIGSTSEYLRNAAVPMMSIDMQYKFHHHRFGLVGTYKQIKPRLFTEVTNSSGIKERYVTDEILSSTAFSGFLKHESEMFFLKVQGVWGQNMSDMFGISGFGVRTFDPTTGYETYTNTNAATGFIDFSYGNDLTAGLFAGYTENLGSDEKLAMVDGAYKIYGLKYAESLKRVWRISPRFMYSAGKTRLGLEIEHTTAEYGSPNNFGKVDVNEKVQNYRILVAVMQFF